MSDRDFSSLAVNSLIPYSMMAAIKETCADIFGTSTSPEEIIRQIGSKPASVDKLARICENDTSGLMTGECKVGYMARKMILGSLFDSLNEYRHWEHIGHVTDFFIRFHKSMRESIITELNINLHDLSANGMKFVQMKHFDSQFTPSYIVTDRASVHLLLLAHGRDAFKILIDIKKVNEILEALRLSKFYEF